MLTKLIRKTHRAYASFVGPPDTYALESRIFHAFSLFLFIVLFVLTFVNFALHLYISTLLTAMVFAIQGISYYLSRYKNKLNVAVIVGVVQVNVITGIGYYYNSGIAGGTLLLYAVSVFIFVSVSQRKYWRYWIGINLCLVFGVTASEYFDPTVIQTHYSTREDKFADNLSSYLATVLLIYMGTVTIRSSYTRQKRLADEKTLALELLNAEKVKLFTIISHDLRTPLASVQQYFDVMAELKLGSDERAELEKDLQSTIANTQELLTNLLRWAKNQMDGATAYLKPVRLRPFLTSTIELFEGIAAKKNIVLTRLIHEDITVQADADMLQLVLRNLLSNAVKFTHNGGHIELKAVIQGDNCVLSIHDNGIGIPDTKRDEIFKLSSASTKGTDNELGTGLGLVLCKDYTHLQGGKIWFDSTEGRGTTFYISLPLATEPIV